MYPEFLQIEEKKLMGISCKMSLLENKTAALWKEFMTSQKNIDGNSNKTFISLQVYPENYFANFNPATTFEKWALADAATLKNMPQTFKAFTIPSGLYAAFLYKGSAENATDFFSYIFTQWLPASKYVLDSRPHFEVLGKRYKNNHPDSEEMVYIPISIKPIKKTSPK